MSDDELGLVRLLQLTSPTLPVGAFAYSQGLEAAIEAGAVRDAASAQRWIGDVLELGVARLEAPLWWRLAAAWRLRDWPALRRWNQHFLVSRETAELRAETVQMGYSLARLLRQLGGDDRDPADDDSGGRRAGRDGHGDALAQLETVTSLAFPTAFTCAVALWRVDESSALTGYLWSWLDNQVLAAIKAVPLGQTQGQRVLRALGARLPAVVRASAAVGDDALRNFTPGLAIASSQHETQYSRLFRS
jgi:urease accessory protein